MRVNYSYPKKLLDYFFDLQHAGVLSNNENIKISEEGSEIQGDVVKFYVYIENNVIKQMRFKSFGSVATIAGCEYICRYLEGKNISVILDIKPEDILKALELPTIKITRLHY